MTKTSLAPPQQLGYNDCCANTNIFTYLFTYITYLLLCFAIRHLNVFLEILEVLTHKENIAEHKQKFYQCK